MGLRRRLKREKREKRQKPEASESLAPETLGDVASGPWKRIFPWDLPGQQGDWTKKDTNEQ
jgi:hypothetical protein